MLAFIIVTIISVAYAAALILRPETLASLWAAVRALPWVVQLVIWLLFLPWMLSQWVWRTPWPLWLRVLVVGTLVVGTPVAFFPRQR